MRGISQGQGRFSVCRSYPALKRQTMNDLEALQAQQAAYSEFRVSPKAIKPCVAYILAHNPKNKMFNPNDYGFLIATELRRIGEEKGKAIMILKAWNSGNSQALKLRELNGIIGRAYSKLYVYGCNNVMLVEYCPGKENCTYYKSLFTRKGRHRERDFYKYGWQRILNPSQICLYQGLIEIEKIRSLKPGELIVATYRFIPNNSGVSKGVITEGFIRLEKLGLINWKKGLPFKWRETATEIRWIVPIPRPKNDAKMHRL